FREGSNGEGCDVGYTGSAKGSLPYFFKLIEVDQVKFRRTFEKIPQNGDVPGTEQHQDPIVRIVFNVFDVLENAQVPVDPEHGKCIRTFVVFRFELAAGNVGAKSPIQHLIVIHIQEVIQQGM